MEHQLVIRPGGLIEFIYADELRPLLDAGKSRIRRASHVEPAPGQEGRWQADLAPIGGPKLPPTLRRTDALEGEKRWIEANYLLPTSPPSRGSASGSS